MKYRIGILEVTPAELAEATTDGAGKWNAGFWLKRIQQARRDAYRCIELYTEFAPPGDTDFIHALREELAAIGVEMVED